MSGCLDNIQINYDWFANWSDKRNAISSVVSGSLFFIGWWVIIDIAATYPSQTEFNHAYHTCGVFSTLSLVMINAVSNSQVRGDAMTEGVMGARGARVWLLLGFLIGFSSMIASAWIMFQVYVVPNEDLQWPGVALFMQNFFIFVSSLLFKFGRTEELWN